MVSRDGGRKEKTDLYEYCVGVTMEMEEEEKEEK